MTYLCITVYHIECVSLCLNYCACVTVFVSRCVCHCSLCLLAIHTLPKCLVCIDYVVRNLKKLAPSTRNLLAYFFRHIFLVFCRLVLFALFYLFCVDNKICQNLDLLLDTNILSVVRFGHRTNGDKRVPPSSMLCCDREDAISHCRGWYDRARRGEWMAVCDLQGWGGEGRRPRSVLFYWLYSRLGWPQLCPCEEERRKDQDN